MHDMQQREQGIRPGTTPALYRRELYFYCKRALDLLIATALLLLLAPLMLIIAAWIKLDSPGPVLFVQKRVGARRRWKNGALTWETYLFPMLKFRSMQHRSDETLHREYVLAYIRNDQSRMDEIQGTTTQVRKLVADPRITRAGYWLRKTSLDELPQLLNVFRGEMSLVGPRPAIKYEVDVYEQWHRQRLEATPGLTGLWQIRGRDTSSFEEMVELDIQYIREQSLWIDLTIITLTPLALLRGRIAA
jgi:lipopolysaccharide/colanic/teichoic acid biosynthesis glycosyltransferase